MAMADYDLSDLAAVVGNRNGEGNGTFSNGEGLLWLLFILILGGGNWNRGWGGNGGGAGAVGGDALYPWMNLQQNFTDILQSLCGGFAGVTSAITNGFANAETAATARQMADMNQMFGLSQQLAQCCCDNRLGIANLGADIAREACADRAAVSDGVRDIMQNDSNNTQRILDKLCQLELDGVKGQLAQAERENLGLQNQLNMATFQASQANQNALLQQGFNNEVDALYNRLKNCPVPSMPVYGQTPIFTCNGGGCGCGN